MKRVITCPHPGCDWSATAKESKAVGVASAHLAVHYGREAVTTCKDTNPKHDCKPGKSECLREMVHRHLEKTRAPHTTATVAPAAPVAALAAARQASFLATAAQGDQQQAPARQLIRLDLLSRCQALRCAETVL